MTFPILASLLVRLVVLLPFQLLRLSLATPSRWTPLALSVFLHCVVALLLTNLIQRNQSAAFSSGKVRPNHETNINIIARRTGKDVNSHTVLDGIITTIMATIQRIN